MFVLFLLNILNINEPALPERDETDPHVAVLRRQRGRPTNGQHAAVNMDGQRGPVKRPTRASFFI